MLRASVHSDLYHKLLDLGEAMRFPIEGLHTETGPGVLEAALTYCEALEAADRAALFKTFVKVLAQRHGLMATFMAKWSNSVPGQSGHLHISLQKSSGESVFHDPSKTNEMSDAMRWFLGGQQALMPELLAMIACTVNSYSRLIPGYWAPTSATWGVENRTTALRVIRGGASSQRIEYRIAAADINPHIALAAAIGSGLWGIEHRIEPDAAIVGNAYDQEHPVHRRLPATLYEAAGRLADSAAGARALWRCVRRALRRDPSVGGAGVSQGDHRLGIGPLFRDHLKPTAMSTSLKTVSPVDGRIYVERPLATAAAINQALDAAQRAQAAVGAITARHALRNPGARGGRLHRQGGCDRKRNHLADGTADSACAERDPRLRGALARDARSRRHGCSRRSNLARKQASGGRSSGYRWASSSSLRPGIILTSPR